MTSETRTVIPEIDKIPKAERAQVEADMRKPVVAPEQTVKNRKCVTSAMVRNWLTLTGVDHDYAATGAAALKLAWHGSRTDY